MRRLLPRLSQQYFKPCVTSRVSPRRAASTAAGPADWVQWLKNASTGASPNEKDGKILLFAGLGSYPHTPNSPTESSMRVWEEASEALLTPDMTIGYAPTGMEEFAGSLRGGRGIRGWLRGWVEGRTLGELMARPDVTAAFILSSSIAILASAREKAGSEEPLPAGTTHLAGHGFIGTLTALVAADRIDLPTGVRLARIYADLPPHPAKDNINPPKYLTTILSARSDISHSMSTPSTSYPDSSEIAESSSAPVKRRRAMQLVLDEVHALQKEWELDTEWAQAGIINSSTVLGVTGTQSAVLQAVDRLQLMGLANPVFDVVMPCPYNTKLMQHALPRFKSILERCYYMKGLPGLTVLDPVTTQPMVNLELSLRDHLTHQVRWHKTLFQLYNSPSENEVDRPVKTFMTVGRGAKGLGIMLKSEIKRCVPHAGIRVEEFGVGELDHLTQKRRGR